MTTEIFKAKSQLENHHLLIGDSLYDVRKLRTFMEHHVYAVWDFMSLAKSIQHIICPSGPLWLPKKSYNSVRFINEIILAEESDINTNGGYISHLDLYLLAMEEIGADTSKFKKFLSIVEKFGINCALEATDIPEPSKEFMENTFSVINSNQISKIAAVFSFSRETVIPGMFKGILDQLELSRINAPYFHYYLERHIHLDSTEHGPMSDNLVSEFCLDDTEVEKVVLDSISSRSKLWDKVYSLVS